MRGPQVTLPAEAQAVLDNLLVRRDAELDAGRAAQSRISMLPAEGAEAIKQRLVEDRDRHHARQRDLALLCSRLLQWHLLLRLRPGETLEMAPAPQLRPLRAGETGSARVRAVREEIKTGRERLAAAKAAPLPLADQLKAAEAFIAAKAMIAKPRIAIVRDEFQAQLRDEVDLLAVISWLAPKNLLAAFKAELESRPQQANAMPAAEREQRVCELSASLLVLERHEAALLSEANDMLPRPDMDPVALLGVQIISKEAASAAA